jgi:Ca-activated chloride channel homolog
MTENNENTVMAGPVPPVLPLLTADELSRLPADPEAGIGCLRTAAGNLPLAGLDVEAHLNGLVSRVVLGQRFVNPHREPIEATYVFPLPDRGAVTDLRMVAAGRTVVARLQERGAARTDYDAAIAAGRRAAIAEEERPDVFTLRVGNILPGEEVTVQLTIVGVLPVVDGEATFRFPLVVAPRYIPGSPLPGDAVGAGHQPDTDAVPDASRISPPVLLPGFPHPVPLHILVELDPAGLPMGEPRSSLHAVLVSPGLITFLPGERADRDVVLRIPLGRSGGPSAALTLVPDPASAGDGDAGNGNADGDGTFQAVVLPPDLASGVPPRDVVLLLDRSGSMAGWKMVAARRAAARIVDTLTDHDRFAVLAFDSVVETSDGGTPVMRPATDRNRFRAVEFLAGLAARGGTELAEPLRLGLALLNGSSHPLDNSMSPEERSAEAGRDPVLVLVTDGQVGNEDQLLRDHAAGLGAVRVHTVGIDRAVNAGFLGRLAGWGGGRCELVESEDRLDEAMAGIHRRIGSPVVVGMSVEAGGLALIDGTFGSPRLADVFPGVPWVLRGRYRNAADQDEFTITVRGATPDGRPWSVTAVGGVSDEPALTATWARGQVRDLEDRYLVQSTAGSRSATSAAELERRIVATSLRFGVLCRFTSYVAIDERVVTDGTTPRTIVQPVEQPSGWAETPPAVVGIPLAAQSAHLFSTRRRGTGSEELSVSPAPIRRATPMTGAFLAPAAPAAVPVPARAVPGGSTPENEGGASREDDELTWKLLERELTRLRALTTEPAARRLAALIDLGSWLTVVPAPTGVSAAAWRRVLAALRPERWAGEPFGVVWQRVLDAFAALWEPDRMQPR